MVKNIRNFDKVVKYVVFIDFKGILIEIVY